MAYQACRLSVKSVSLNLFANGEESQGKVLQLWVMTRQYFLREVTM
jgi:hypothetical protein